MGIDGTNTLLIRGPAEVLQRLKESKLVFPLQDGHPEYFQTLQENYFGQHLTVAHEEKYWIVFKYAFRNQVPKDYLKCILQAYPQIWMKNEYESDAGFCGVWIAHIYQGEISEQEVEWTEPSYEECIYETDFSK